MRWRQGFSVLTHWENERLVHLSNTTYENWKKLMLPTDSVARKGIPVYRGFLKIFPDAVAAVSQLTALSTNKHNPGGDVGWIKEKSPDELDAAMRHMLDDIMAPISEANPIGRDEDGALHATKLAWRTMANLQRLADSGVNIYAEITDALDNGKVYEVTLEEEWVEPPDQPSAR